MIRAVALCRRVRTESGKRLGRVHEIHVDGGRVVALTCGAGGMLQRLTQSRHGHRIAWERVIRIDADAIIVSDTH